MTVATCEPPAPGNVPKRLMLAFDPALSSAIAGIVALEACENLSLHVLRFAEHRPIARGTTLVVHPGDASAEPGIAAHLEAMSADLDCAVARGDHIVVLHRFSSSYDGGFIEEIACSRWFNAVANAGVAADHLYSDQLDAVNFWLLKNLAADPGYPLRVTGLWGDEKDGCAAFIARGLASIGAVLYDQCPKARDRAQNEGPGWL